MSYSAERIDTTKNIDLNLTKVEASLREKIRHYKRAASEIEEYLSLRPAEWGRFQVAFDQRDFSPEDTVVSLIRLIVNCRERKGEHYGYVS